MLGLHVVFSQPAPRNPSIHDLAAVFCVGGEGMNPILLHVMLVVFLATLIRSAFGFGEALIAVPLLALRIPVEVAAPLAVLVSITVAAVIIVQDWRKIHFHSAGWLVLSTLFGIPLGLALLIR